MVLNTIRKWYRRTPESVRKPIEFVPIKYRLGGSDFSETYSFLERSEKWSREQLEDYQREQLDQLLQFATETVPYYQDQSLPHEDPFRNLKVFPIVEKEEIRNRKEEFESTSSPSKQAHKITTGGTSGEPFAFTLADSAYGKEWAFIMHGWKRVGYSPGDQLITFKAISYGDTEEGKYWKYNPIYNTYEFSPYHLTIDNIDKYVRKINAIGPDYIHGYPSAITKLANLVEESPREFPDIEGVLAASENVYQTQREIIEEALNTRLFSHYGQSEKVALAAECEQSNKYHLYPQYGVTEILDEDGNEVAVGETGEIVATGFLNRAMPFIRYKTGDYATKGQIGACSCRRQYRVLQSIQGREEKERSIYVDESHEVAIHLIYYAMHGSTLDSVSSIQFYQQAPGEIVVRIEPRDDPDSIDTGGIINAFKGRLGEEFGVDIEFVDRVELTNSGKKQLLIQDYNP
ncbi:phenylacetate--CoA ligase family protein [Natronorubrum sp. DTA28]|uniref:phenylacetate--CoA ligase family protein n=1 Tax=Natronorubrum sp. DTA28 TaxID=3447019 RepID=UPI003F84596F